MSLDLYQVIKIYSIQEYLVMGIFMYDVLGRYNEFFQSKGVKKTRISDVMGSSTLLRVYSCIFFKKQDE